MLTLDVLIKQRPYARALGTATVHALHILFKYFCPHFSVLSFCIFVSSIFLSALRFCTRVGQRAHQAVGDIEADFTVVQGIAEHEPEGVQ